MTRGQGPSRSALPALTLEQRLHRAPQILGGRQTAIDQKRQYNSRGYLDAVGVIIKVGIDVPSCPAAERAATDLGPGPAREVLTSLLRRQLRLHHPDFRDQRECDPRHSPYREGKIRRYDYGHSRRGHAGG